MSVSCLAALCGRLRKIVASKLVCLALVFGSLALTAARADLAVVANGATGGSAYSLTGTAYSQSFDGLPSSGSWVWADDSSLPGWYAVTSDGTVNTAAVSIDGTSNMADLVIGSVGAAGSSDRALSYHTRVAAKTTYLGLALTNAAERDLTSFTVGYTPEQWRENTTGRTLTYDVQYRIGAVAGDLASSSGWTTIPGLSFNTGANGAVGATANLDSGAVAVTVPAGSSLWIRWALSNSAASSTSSHDILAIDNVVFSATAAAVDTAPVFTLQPTAQLVAVGDDVTFTVAATGVPAPTYQWQLDGATLPGATAATLTLESVQLGQAGAYTVVATNSAGTVTSDAATLTVSPTPLPPQVTADPVSTSVSLGASVTFTATVAGTAPFTYQWNKDGSPLPDAIAATLTIDPVGAEDAGSYTVTVGNATATVTSGAAVLTVALPPSITAAPMGLTVAAGATASFAVTAEGTAPLTYQWSLNGTALAGATAATLDVSDIDALDAGDYRVVVTNAVGSTTSATATLVVTAAPTIVQSPADRTATVGGTVTLAVVAAGTGPFTYAWFKDDEPIDAATAATLELTGVAVADSGAYHVAVTNAYGTTASATATVTVSTALPESAFNLAGFGRLTTGGGELAESASGYVQVYTPGQFRLAITSSATRVIEIMNDLALGWNEIPAEERTGRFRSNATPKLHPALITSGVSQIDIQDLDNVTIFSRHGARILHGEFNVKRCTNLIIRNLAFDEMWEWDEATKGDYDSNDWDFITVDIGSTNVWIDHCDFGKAYDGVIDVKGGTNNVTISWCRFREDDGGPNSFVRQQIEKLEENPTAYSMYNFLRTNGFSVEDIIAIARSQKKGHLVGATSFSSENPDLSVTLHHNLYLGMQDRLPRLRGGNAHVYNIHVDNRNAFAAKALWDQRYAAMASNNAVKLTNGTYHFGVTQNGSISTEGGAVLVQKCYYEGVRYALRNNQTDPNDSSYTGKIRGEDLIFIFGDINFRGGSDTPDHPLGPTQAPEITPFTWTGISELPYSYTMDEPDQVPALIAQGAGAGRIDWSADNWLKTSYASVPVAPAIVQQPPPQTVPVGNAVTFTVSATGSVPLTYQWRKDGSPITGATAASYTIAATTAADAGSYSVVVTNSTGSATSSVAVLTVDTTPIAPTISTAPTSQAVAVGGTASFAVIASGTAPLSYQWQKDAADLAGQTGSVLTLATVAAADAGDYRVIVTNAAGAATSASATLTVVMPPAIATAPQARTAVVGDAVSLTVTATGTAPFTYQWHKDTAAIDGADAATLTFAAVAAADAGSYHVTVTNAAGTATSEAAVLTVLVPPQIGTAPADRDILVGATVTFAVAATGTAPLTYQWLHNDTPIADATADSLTLTSAQPGDAGTYAVVVTNAAGHVTSAAATLHVSATAEAPTIVTPPQSLTVSEGQSATFTVTAAGTEPFTYQWSRDGSPLGGNAQSAAYAIGAVQAGDAGAYTVTVSNEAGSVTSGAARLTVTASTTRDFYVAPDGIAEAPGTLAQPTTLPHAIALVEPGYTIWLRGGTYTYAVGVPVSRGNNGADGAEKRIFAYPGESPVLNFSGQAVASTERGLTLNGNFWHVKGLVVEHAGDNGIFIGGNNNTVEQCVTRYNADTGLQLGRYSSSALREEWPSRNLILNCTSHDNKDPGNENADGFACKLTTGPGNAFIGCIAHHNIDDGWDLFTKTDTGPIDPVYIDQCISYLNGVLSDGSGSGSGDKNGFKLGGEDIAVVHYVTRSIAFGNGKNGFTWNSNPGAIRMINNLAFDNAQGNYKFDQAAPIFLNNVSLWTTGSGQNDRYGGNSGIATGSSNVFWFASGTPKSRNDQGLQVSAASFVSLTPPVGGFARRSDGSINLGDFARPVEGTPLRNAGTLPDAGILAQLPFEAAAYYDGLPDIGVVEVRLDSPPAILVAPLAQQVLVGAAVSLFVEADGPAPLTYQWLLDGAPISGATAATYHLDAAQLADAGSYAVAVTNAFGTTTSTAVQLTVNQPVAPAIATGPTSRTVSLGLPTTFTVVATGTAPFTYQWRQDGSPISGATGAAFTIGAVAVESAGVYDVVVTNVVGSTTSDGATLTVDTTPVAPVIATAPVSTSVQAGATASFTVSATGTPELTYQWFRNDTALVGETSATLVLGTVGLADAGAYHVVVTNSAGAATSAKANLTVTLAPDTIYLDDSFADGSRAGQNLPGSAAWWTSSGSSNFTATTGAATQSASSSRTLLAYFTNSAATPVVVGENQRLTFAFTFQFSGFDSSAVADTPTFLVGLLRSVANPDATTGTGFTADGPPNTGARVTGDFGSSNPSNGEFALYTGYAAATVFNGTVAAEPISFRARDKAHAGLLNNIAAVTVLPNGTPAAGLAPATGTDYRGTLELTHTVGGMTVAYRVVRVSDEQEIMAHSVTETVVSSTAFDTVAFNLTKASGSATYNFVLKQAQVALANLPTTGTAPTVTTAPVAQDVAAGAGLHLGVQAKGDGPLAYQWRRNGEAIAGATGATYDLASPTAADSGFYDVVITNAGGSVTPPPVRVVVAAASVTGWSAAHDVVGRIFRDGHTVRVHNALATDGTLTALSWQLLLPEGWTVVSEDTAITPDAAPTAGTAGLAEWQWSNLTGTSFAFTCTLRAPEHSQGPAELVALVEGLAGGVGFATLADPDPLVLAPGRSHHSADTNGDTRIDLAELLRVIQLYNTREGTTRTGRYRLGSGTEDGFAPDTPGTEPEHFAPGAHHSADTNRDGQLSLNELLRVIQLYNQRDGSVRTGEYHPAEDTDDGFAPGAAL